MRRPSIDWSGSIVLAIVTVAVLLVIGVSNALKLAADDLYNTNQEVLGALPPGSRLPIGIWLSSQIGGEFARGDLDGRNARADELSYRGDRVRELAGAGALAGLLVAVLTMRPTPETMRVRGASRPAANTTSNGTA
jgi:hypothetical protein